MDKDICRAITFINYHIPLTVPEQREAPPYITLGFFDGMLTERIEVRYEEYELKELWKYSIKRANNQLGQYSHQNIFCFSRDTWNQSTDEQFWSEEANREYPLTFVVFLQLRDYRSDPEGIGQQCRTFNEAAHGVIGDSGLCYTYNTIDKNDFVVCLKCKKYGMAVETIKKLHRTKAEIVYSYSVFSVSKEVLSELEAARYQYLYDEEIKSICFKGIVNSYDLQGKYTLDQKYRDFCMKLMDRLYDKQAEDEQDYKIYDILGDDDFRLIARYVRLGKLLQQFMPGGLLSYEGDVFQFTFFSSNMVLNTQTPDDLAAISDAQISDSKGKRVKEFRSPVCDCLENTMTNISRIVSNPNACVNEKTITFCHAVWQLLQSLKPLETAPTKQYDFWSLYLPFSMLVRILEDKLGKLCINQIEEKERRFVNNEEIYNFIHKISTTLHGTLRTDIQFFQIRDFNVIVHYAPAKLRAFYSFWVLRLTDYYNKFNTDNVTNEYSFILAPGMYQKIGVSELFTEYAQEKRLMLIKVPERHLYAVRWFPVILAHEVSHFVGYASRKRCGRHKACMAACIRVLFLEINAYRWHTSRVEWQPMVEECSRKLRLYEELSKRFSEEEARIRRGSDLYPHEYHSKNSCMIIEQTFRAVNERYMEKIIAEDSARVRLFLKDRENVKEKSISEQCYMVQDIAEYSNNMDADFKAFIRQFESKLLSSVLNMLLYICKESYADLIAVLTLDLSPNEYICSFCGSGSDVEGRGLQKENVWLLPVRIGYTMQAVSNAVKNKKFHFSVQFCDEWTENIFEKEVFKKVLSKFNAGSLEQGIAMDAFGYTTGIRDCNDQISKYSTIYNYQKGYFANVVLDFFNDRLVWDSLNKYFDESVEAYINILADDHVREMRQKLLTTYDKVARGSIMSMSQEIENFLAEFEYEKKQQNGLI
jgi:hypothetical protein